MKKILLIIISAIAILSMFGCNNKNTISAEDQGKRTTLAEDNSYYIVEEVLPYSYSDDEDTFKNNDKVSLDGFKATEKNPANAVHTKADAMKIAQNEVSKAYNKINIFFDRTQGKWKIIFSKDKKVTDDSGKESTENTMVQTVYVDEDGYTLAIVTA